MSKERSALRDAPRPDKRKPAVTARDIETCWNALTPEGRAHVAMQAVYATGIRPATLPK
jgi:hypothetical protein